MSQELSNPSHSLTYVEAIYRPLEWDATFTWDGQTVTVTDDYSEMDEPPFEFAFRASTGRPHEILREFRQACDRALADTEPGVIPPRLSPFASTLEAPTQRADGVAHFHFRNGASFTWNGTAAFAEVDSGNEVAAVSARMLIRAESGDGDQVMGAFSQQCADWDGLDFSAALTQEFLNGTGLT